MMMHQGQQSQSRARKPHPQWAFHQEPQWMLPGHNKKLSDDKELLRKNPQRPPLPAWGDEPRRRPRRQNNEYSPNRNQAPRASNRGHAFSNGNSPVRQSYNTDPFYQPPPKVPQFDHGRLVTFYKNGDPVFRGLPLSINRSFANFQAVLYYLTKEWGFVCQRVFQWPQGYEIFTLADFEHQSSYVVSDQHYLDRSINYGNMLQPAPGNLKVNTSRIGDNYSDYNSYYDDDRASSFLPPISTRNSNYSSYSNNPTVTHHGSKRAEDIPLYRDYDPSDTLENYPVATIRLINNFNRQAHVEVSLSGARKNFKMLLHEFGQFFGLRDCSIWTSRLPCKRVNSLSQLYAELDKNPQFLVCGSEEMPTEAAGAHHQLGGPSDYSPKQQAKGKRSRGEQKPPAAQQSRKQHRKGGKYDPRFSDSDIDDLPTGAYSGDGLSSMNEKPMSPIRATRSYESLTRKNKQPGSKTPLQPIQPKKPVTKAQLLQEGKIKKRIGLQLEWVYGYRGKDARENLFFLPTGELLYYVGVIAVVFDPINETQKHYKAHTEDINCMALHPEDELVATGQISPAHSDQQPHVRVWNYNSLNTVAIIGLGVFQASICCVGFSPDGSKLMVLDEGDRHSLSIWKWSEDKQLAQVAVSYWQTTSDTVVWGKFCPNDPNALITFGKEHLYMWRFASGKLVRDRSSCKFNDQFSQPKFVTAAAFLPGGDLITGDSNGAMVVWNRDPEGNFVINDAYSQGLATAHKKSIFAIVVTGPNHILSGGGLEVKAWELKDGRVVNNGNQTILESSGFIRSLVVGKNNIVFAGTTKNCILEGALLGKFRYLVQGHSDEVWALSCHSKDSTFVTGGYDCQLIKWFAPIHRAVWRTPLEKQCLSVAFHPHEDVVAIGTSIGRLVVLNSYNGMHICSVQMAGSTDLLTCLQFAPEGDMIVCGSQDGPIYVSLVEDGGRTYRRHKAGIIENNLGAVQNLDWHDEVAELVQLSTRSGNHAFATIEDMKLVKVEPSTVSDEWSTYSCPTGKLIKPIMNRLKSGEVLTASDMVSRNSPLGGLIAASTSYGRIMLTSLRSDIEIEAKVIPEPLPRRPKRDMTVVLFGEDYENLRSRGGHLHNHNHTPRKVFTIRDSERTPLFPKSLHPFQPRLRVRSQIQENRMCSQNITAMRFTSDGRYLIAVAGKDGSIYQYATNVTELWGASNVH